MDKTAFPTEAWSGLYHLLREKLGPLDTYWALFDSTKKEDLVQGTLSADLPEIYFDLKRDLNLDKTGISQADFAWELRFSFWSHWGRHALEALKAMYDHHLEAEIRRGAEIDGRGHTVRFRRLPGPSDFHPHRCPVQRPAGTN